MKVIVTRNSITRMLNNADKKYVTNVIGHALVVLLNNQTAEEQQDNTVKIDNGIGFTGADGRSGSITAKYFLKHGTLQDWQIERWTKAGKNGYPRIAKYHAQLNMAAHKKQQRKQREFSY